YIIDGVRFGMIGVSDSSPWLGLSVVGTACVVVLGICLRWMRTGYRLKA
ncbi:MAG: multidrug ABC transporter permease, partial [Paracoccaceae bacterium]|nr:multidrug ABC transporter permease [Paracoccaceae bacterium]